VIEAMSGAGGGTTATSKGELALERAPRVEVMIS
jgi:hypothetical protein